MSYKHTTTLSTQAIKLDQCQLMRCTQVTTASSQDTRVIAATNTAYTYKRYAMNTNQRHGKETLARLAEFFERHLGLKKYSAPLGTLAKPPPNYKNGIQALKVWQLEWLPVFKCMKSLHRTPIMCW